MANLIIFALLLLAGYYYGGRREKVHYKSIRTREKLYIDFPHNNFGKKGDYSEFSNGQVFYGSVVVGQDYFKGFIFGLRNLFGGRVTVYESLMDRGRREALLRLKRKAKQWGAHQVINLRYETSTIGSNQGKNNSSGSIEVLAYGTGLKK